MKAKQFLILIAIIFLFATVFLLSGTLFSGTGNVPTKVVENFCKFIETGNNKELEKIIAPRPIDFVERLHLAYGGKLANTNSLSLDSAKPSKQSNLAGKELLQSVISNSFALPEKVNIKEILDVKEFQKEAKVKVILSESDLHRERICIFLLTKESDEWKIFYIDNDTLPESLHFGEETLPERKL